MKDREKQPLVVSTPAELAKALATASGIRSVVMTMGALHEGHLDLARHAREVSDFVVATIFVNPLQFAPTEDLATYPRDLAGDIAKLVKVGVDLVYTPTGEDIFPHGDPQVTINPGPMGAILEGATRPTHFGGVLQIVAKLLHHTRPDIAVFGKKDAQQLALVSQMVRDLDFPVEIHPVEIRRDEDGVALSSRNAYLSATEREQARALVTALRLAADIATQNQDLGAAHQAALSQLTKAPGINLDYLALVDPRSFQPLATEATHGLLLVAAKVGTTRLIDNMDLYTGEQPG